MSVENERIASSSRWKSVAWLPVAAPWSPWVSKPPNPV
jgi:hypothetical protein